MTEGAAPILPMHDAATSRAFYERVGFTTGRGSDDEYLMVERGLLRLHFFHAPEVDPFSTAGMAYLYVDDPDGYREDILACGVIDGASSADLHERWRTEHDVSRVGAIEDKPWRMREFALLDPVNNLLRVGRSLR
jgi:hypothetical protein